MIKECFVRCKVLFADDCKPDCCLPVPVGLSHFLAEIYAALELGAFKIFWRLFKNFFWRTVEP